jgi:hypothetical protein
MLIVAIEVHVDTRSSHWTLLRKVAKTENQTTKAAKQWLRSYLVMDEVEEISIFKVYSCRFKKSN